jgi:hypothetical protein
MRSLEKPLPSGRGVVTTSVTICFASGEHLKGEAAFLQLGKIGCQFNAEYIVNRMWHGRTIRIWRRTS